LARAKERSGSELSNFERDWGEWGEFCVPRFYELGRDSRTDQRASTISLWRDLASVYRFVYAGLHLEAFKKRSEWFLAPRWPTYAIWWIADDHVPTWSEACKKLEQLHDEGATPSCFDFKHCFDQFGSPLALSTLKGSSRDQSVLRVANALDSETATGR